MQMCIRDRHGVGRVIARPFIGESGHYTRTSNRHDFSIEPPKVTMLDQLKEKGFDVIGIGKIHDIFAGKGLTEFSFTKNNEDGDVYKRQAQHRKCQFFIQEALEKFFRCLVISDFSEIVH